MPIEIREVIIRAEIRKSDESAHSMSDAAPVVDEESIISACVEQVMQILRDKEER